MKPPFLARRSLLGLPNALVILLVIFFLVPFGLRGARLSLGRTENNVKDWLPADFRETAELSWFANYFAGERFVLATWPGASMDDQRLTLFERKLRAEASETVPAEVPEDWAHAREVAEELRLLLPAGEHKNWGGRNEKWLISESGRWYFVTPDGRLYRWEGEQNAVGGTVRAVQRLFGGRLAEGQFVAAFGGEAGDRIANPYYNDPALLTAALFKSVQSGPAVARRLAAEGGPLWPIDLTDPERKPIVALRRAYERLTGTLFAPAVPDRFSWTPEAFAAALPAERREALPERYAEIVRTTLQQIVDEQYDGDFQRLATATDNAQARHWYAVYDALQVQPPERQTAVLVTLTELGQRNLPHVVGRGVLGGPRGRILQLAQQAGVEPAPSPSIAPPPFNQPAPIGITGRPPLRLGGPPVDNVAIDEEGTITLVRLVGYSVLVGLGLSYLCFRSVRLTLMVFFVGGVSAVFSLAIVWWSGAGVDAILMSMPSLVYVLGMSSAIHLINYYRDEVRDSGLSGAPGRALRHAWMPCALAAGTTAIGLMSLYTSNIVPIRKFGWFTAVGVIATLAVLFAYLPAALETFAPARRPREEEEKEVGPDNDGSDDEGRLIRAWTAVGEFVVRRHTSVALGCLLLLVVCSVGIWKIRTSVQLLKMFDDESRIIRDYAWLEENFGKLVPMELVLRVPPQAITPTEDTATALQPLERVEAVSRIQTVVEQAFGETGMDVVGRAMSAATFLPPLPEPSNSYDVVRARFNNELAASRDELLDSDYVRQETTGPLAGSELWRISLRVSALSDVDYGRFIYQLRRAVEPVLEAYRTRNQVLRSLQEPAADDDADAGGGRSEPRVAVLGRGRPQPLGVEPVLLEASTEAISADPNARAAIDSQAIFDAALWELLQNERIPSPIWHDPSSGALAGLSRSDQWARLLEAMDVVVLLHDHPDYDVDFIRQHAPNLIDARDVSTDRSVPAIVGGVPIPEDSGPLQVVYTGVVPVVYKAQRTLLYSLIESIAWAFVLIAGVMAVLLNPGRMPMGALKPVNLGYGGVAGLVAMLPNVFPVAVIFGLMGHLDIVVDIGTMMTASVAMGVAVDDTIHFLAWFRQHLDSGMSRSKAIVATYRRVAPAMLQTTLIGGLGLYVFALSTFTPTQRFGTLMLVLLGAALVGDLVFLPALLAGPLGRFFRPRPTTAPAASPPPQRPAEGLPSPQETAGQRPAALGQERAAETETADQANSDQPNYRADHPHRQRGSRQAADH